MGLAQNLADLERHARDAADRTGFTYTVLSLDGDVIGCVYVYPPRRAGYDAEVRSWVRASHAALISHCGEWFRSGPGSGLAVPASGLRGPWWTAEPEPPGDASRTPLG